MNMRFGIVVIAVAGGASAAPTLMNTQQTARAAEQVRSSAPSTSMVGANGCSALLQRYQQTLTQAVQAQNKVERDVATLRAAKQQEARIDALQEIVTTLVEQRGYMLNQVQTIDAVRVAETMQQSPAGSLACRLLTAVPTKR